MKERTIFVAGTYEHARYWAQAWGFGPTEWMMASPGSLFGRRITRQVFVCGSDPIDPELVRTLERAGADIFIDAHDLDGMREPRSALDLLAWGH